MIKYSGLIPVYKNDKLEYLKVAVSSMLNQTRSFDEILVIVEGYINKDIKDYLNDLKLPVKVLFIEDQKGPLGFGLPSTLNYGIRQAAGDYIVRLDSDDYSEPNRLEVIDSVLNENLSIDLLSSYVAEYDEKMQSHISTRKVPLKEKVIKAVGRWKNPFNGPAVAFKRTTALSLGGYPIVASNEDYCFWAEFMINGFTVANIKDNLVKMRTGYSMLPRRKSKRYRMGTVQSNAYLYSIGYFKLIHLIWHTLINAIVRRMPLRIFYTIQFKLFRKFST